MEEEEKKISNKRIYTYIAIIFLVIFIIGIIALGVIRIGKGGTSSKTYYSYVINNSYLTNESSLEDDNKSFIVSTTVKYQETLTFVADPSSASIGVYNTPNSYLFGGKGISFTFSIEDETYCLDEVVMDEIKVSNNGDIPTSTLEKDSYVKEYNEETKTFKITISNTEIRYIHSVSLKFAVKNK